MSELANSCRLCGFPAEDAEFQAKKTPVGDRGVRVIVVVANSVSVSTPGRWWIIVVISDGYFIVVVYSSFSLPLLLASMSVYSIRMARLTETFFVRKLYIAIPVPE